MSSLLSIEAGLFRAQVLVKEACSTEWRTQRNYVCESGTHGLCMLRRTKLG